MDTKRIYSIVTERHSGSDLNPWSDSDITEIADELGPLPDHYIEFLSIFGSGSIGQSMYSVYGYMEPEDVYDEATAASLKGIILLGDDFAGTCDAYRTRDWALGGINTLGEFEVNEECETFQEYLYARFI